MASTKGQSSAIENRTIQTEAGGVLSLLVCLESEMCDLIEFMVHKRNLVPTGNNN